MLYLATANNERKTSINVGGGSIQGGGVGISGGVRQDLWVSKDGNKRIFGEVHGSGVIGGPHNSGVRPNYGGIGGQIRF
jgi:hypothetical protein